MRRIHKKGEPPHRPNMGKPYERAALLIAAELNKKGMYEFDALSTERHAVYELWKRVFKDIPFPADADVLRTPYHKDPGTA